VWALAAESEMEAEHLFSSRVIARLNRDRGIYAPLLSPAEAQAHALSEGEQLRVARLRERAIYGTAPAVAAKLRGLAESQELAEIAVLTTVHDPGARRRSYSLVAQAWGLVPSGRPQQAA
jgi:alkanesulfonate monooxygenase SsuD/methylene tetrahydromethanopterin reductase-like flavin-dependent oxidoreductase (luciferase family)